MSFFADPSGGIAKYSLALFICSSRSADSIATLSTSSMHRTASGDDAAASMADFGESMDWLALRLGEVTSSVSRLRPLPEVVIGREGEAVGLDAISFLDRSGVAAIASGAYLTSGKGISALFFLSDDAGEKFPWADFAVFPFS